MSQWMPANGSSPNRYVVLMVHGLSMEPERMRDLAEIFQNLGGDVLRVTLSGHGGSEKDQYMVNRKHWLEEMTNHYCVANAYAQAHGLPLIFVGYSLGALIQQDLLNHTVGIHFDSEILLSPPVALHFYIYILRLLSPFGEAIMPHAIAAFRGLIHSYEAVQINGLERSKISTLVFIDPKDEVVSYLGLKYLRMHFELPWKIEKVTNRYSAESHKAHHYIVEKKFLGEDQWNQMATKIAQFLQVEGVIRTP